jgi:hypothetical protein
MCHPVLFNALLRGAVATRRYSAFDDSSSFNAKELQFRQWGRERSPGPGCERNFCEELRPQLIGDCLTGGLRGRRISGLVYERKSLLGASRQRRRQKPQLLDATPRDHWLGASVSATEERANFPEVSESSVLIGAPSSELWCGPRPAFPATRG